MAHYFMGHYTFMTNPATLTIKDFFFVLSREENRCFCWARLGVVFFWGLVHIIGYKINSFNTTVFVFFIVSDFLLLIHSAGSNIGALIIPMIWGTLSLLVYVFPFENNYVAIPSANFKYLISYFACSTLILLAFLWRTLSNAFENTKDATKNNLLSIKEQKLLLNQINQSTQTLKKSRI